MDEDGISRDGNLSGRTNWACGQMGHGVEALWVTSPRLLDQGARRPGKEKAWGMVVVSKLRFEQVQLKKPAERQVDIKSALGAWVWSSGDLVSLET